MKLLKEINTAADITLLNENDSEKSIDTILKNHEESYKTLERIEAQMRKEGNTATAASLSNILASMHQNIKLFKAAKSDLGKKYDRPGAK